MVILRIINNTAQEQNIPDANGVVVPASSFADFTDAGNIRSLIVSQNLRTLVDAAIVSLSDGTNEILPENLSDYWVNAGFFQDSKKPPSALFVASPDGTRWKIVVDNSGILATEKVV
jgi:hypothetical protein